MSQFRLIAGDNPKCIVIYIIVSIKSYYCIDELSHIFAITGFWHQRIDARLVVVDAILFYVFELLDAIHIPAGHYWWYQ